MKTNAIIRIVTWSLVIIVLFGILMSGIGFRGLSTRWRWDEDDSTVETHIPQRIENEPTTDVPTPAGTIASEEPFYAYNSADIHSVCIEWVSGAITLMPTEGSEILISETGDTDRYPMVVKQKSGALTIQYSKELSNALGITINDVEQKDLTILIPRDMALKELELDVASAAVLVKDLTIQEVDFDGASGKCEFADCQVDSLEIDTASGDVAFTGTLNSLDFDAASASFTGIFTNVPKQIEMDSMSGDLDLTLPEDAGFAVTMDGLNSDFTSDFETTSRNGTYIHGDGTCRIQMDAMSGDVIIRKAK